jgi:hypothetical protein
MARTKGPVTPLPEVPADLNERIQKWLEETLGLLQFRVYEETLTASAVGAGNSSRQTFTVSGLTVRDIVVVIPPQFSAGMHVTNARVSAADTLQLMFFNNTAGGITPSGAFKILAYRS